MKNKKMIFLLGGYDLEMITIREILEENSIEYLDKELSWGAKLSDYANELEIYKDYTIYGIELENDITSPKNYKEIDHHNENSNKPSSLEQVAKILDIQLNRYQQLVAANDKEYISGMKKLCATPEEIDEIRLKDRQSQGITQDDENLAIKSTYNIKHNIVCSKTSYFSAISDRIYNKFDQYIIYNDDKIVFYNYEVDYIIKFFNDNNIKKDDYYFGGGEFGFIGIKDNILDKIQIEKLLKEFKLMEKNKEEVISYHTFMLPFTFKGKFEKNKNWIYKQFKINEQKDYNEYVYFYKHVQDALYNNDETKEKISKYYEYKEQDGKFIIDCKKGIYELELDGISLRIFNTNIAILSFNLKNTKSSQNKPEDILAINDFGRRIYPTFLGNNFTFDTKQALLSCKISLCFKDKNPISDDFSRFDKKENLDTLKNNLLPNYITTLIENNFNNKDNPLRPIIDDRMFVISQYHNDDCVNRLKKYDDTNGYAYENDGFWYEYIFVDGDGKTCQSKYMTKEFIKNSTYDRWVEWGTLFGISRYSFVALTGSGYGNNVLLPHMQTMYFQIFSLLLAYRASIIKFSDDIQYATKDDDKLFDKTKKVYKNYINFLNKLYFKEVTAQDQGIELYNQAMKIMDIDKYMKDLDNEINELHSYTDMLEEKKTAGQMNTLTWIGAILLPPSIVTGFYGMNNNILPFEEYSIEITFGSIIIPILIGLCYWLKNKFKGES